MSAPDYAWLAAWLESLELELDVPFPGGVNPADGVAALLEYNWRIGHASRELLDLIPNSVDGITVRHGWKPNLDVFSVEWEQTVNGVKVDAFLDMNLRRMAEQAAQWDTTFLEAEYLADHGTPADLSRFARLVRWRFRAAPLQDREMLYIVVPHGGGTSAGAADGGPWMVSYISVRGARFPVAAGYARARNCVPSFDLCEPVSGSVGDDDALRVQHCMTTDIGGRVPNWVWNNVFKSAVLGQNAVEAAHVRDALRGGTNADGTRTTGGGTSSGGPRRQKHRILIAGFGDSGLATAVHLAAQEDVELVGVSPHACHYSAQELGGRLAQPSLWKSVYLLPFSAYRMLDRVRIERGVVSRVDPANRIAVIRAADGSEREEAYDALLICTGCCNGFWRKAPPPAGRDVEADIEAEQAQLAAATTIAVIGGGPSGVSAAYNLAIRHPGKRVHCFVSGAQVLPGYHPRTRTRIEARLRDAGVTIHAGHRALVPDGFACDRLGGGPVSWSTGQPAFSADVVVWAIGTTTPNSGFLPAQMLDAKGYVRTDEYLQVVGHEGSVFAVGDIAATDPGRTSARNDGWALVGTNMLAALRSTPHRMRKYKPPTYRWGSILGPWDGRGYEVDFPAGVLLWVPLRLWNLLWPLVQRFLWAGMRNTVDWTDRAPGGGP